jgi:hypothetical protein
LATVLAALVAAGKVAVVAAEDADFNPLGSDLLPLLVLALGAAMVFGNVVALVRPPERRAEGELRRAPVARTLVMITIGFVGAVWALASLLAA